MIPGGMPKTRFTPKIKGSKKGFMLSVTLVGFIVGALALMMFTGSDGPESDYSNSMNAPNDNTGDNNEYNEGSINPEDETQGESETQAESAQEEEQPDFFIHELKAGEYYSTLAAKYYKDGRKAYIIAKANPTLDANKLPIGAKIKIPNINKKTESAPENKVKTDNKTNTPKNTTKKNKGGFEGWSESSSKNNEKPEKKTTRRTPWDIQDQPNVPDDNNVGTWEKVIICKQTTHYASPGDSPFSLALKYYNSISLQNQIKNANPLFDWNNIKGGEKVVIPEYSEMKYVAPKPEKDYTQKQDVVNDEPKTTSTNTSSDYEIYVVKDGDTLWDLAQSKLGNGTRYKEIKELNGLTSDNLPEGMKLKLPRR